MDNSAAGAGEGLSAGVEGSGLQSTGASQHATGVLVWRYINRSPSLLNRNRQATSSEFSMGGHGTYISRA